MAAECILTALYLPGSPASGCLPRRWPMVLEQLRIAGAGLGDAPALLRKAGFWEEALGLEVPGALSWAESQLSGGHVLSVLHPAYPRRWLEVLGASAPPCVWRRGLSSGPYLAIVGSRKPSRHHRAFVEELTEVAAQLGLGIVSGAAYGIDDAAQRAAARRGVPCLEILPHGFPSRANGRWASQISCYAPETSFSGRQAMARNALIYAAAEFAVAVHPRFKEGGTWHGAVEAHRRRLSRIAVLEEAESMAVRALRGIGLYGIRNANELPELMAMPHAQPALFSAAGT